MQTNAPLPPPQAEVNVFQNPSQIQNSFNELQKTYQQLLNVINGFPIHPQFRACANMNLDQGVMWIKEGLQVLLNTALQQQGQANKPGSKRKRKNKAKGKNK